MTSFKIDESVFDKLADILKKHNLSEIEYKDGDAKIRICAHNNVPTQVCSINTQEQQKTSGEIRSESQISEIKDFSNHIGAIKSPMVGTCYTAPEPGSPNFIEVGDEVQAGQPILIIEAMKVMNLIKAPKSGKIIHVAVSNGDPVEYDQLLLVIE